MPRESEQGMLRIDLLVEPRLKLERGYLAGSWPDYLKVSREFFNPGLKEDIHRSRVQTDIAIFR